ncbi:rRNA maturation RNase YbeY [endosymbiont of Pachyrhynchus infernalis]|uniref:rRNA maturation RNase YbeY n=1 Tax=endosymbiont of Pachyrhynchus infernalis TaxID=1971488 RepID=UPI000DC73650|nr:rRNA maturation RNase YbeY [endosymbiont of Pachyrhynchus infernalis]BBA84925.1 endoribonuclease YbeY [endosymbiont of Pachyrhynchus infernalis]
MILNVSYNNINRINLPNMYFFEKFIKYIINYNNFYILNIKIVSKSNIKKLNNIFNKKNKPTNSLTFLKNINIKNNSINVGDIALCKSLIEKESKKYNINLYFHWSHILVHSCLHLLGFTHKNYDDTIFMENKEIEILKKFNIPNPHI